MLVATKHGGAITARRCNGVLRRQTVVATQTTKTTKTTKTYRGLVTVLNDTNNTTTAQSPCGDEYRSHRTAWWAIGGFAVVAGVTSTSMTKCEGSSSATTTPKNNNNTVDEGPTNDGTRANDASMSSQSYGEVPNPVWPMGISDADVEALVDDCLRDPSINIATVPDYLERQIYRSTIKLTLNAIYQSIGGIHGMDVLGHELRVLRKSTTADGITTTNNNNNEMIKQGTGTARREFQLSQMRGSVDDRVLDKVVDGLLANKAVNQPLVPDIVERQLYKNCLTIIFRLLDMMAATFTITCCGHDLRITVEPSRNPVITDSAVRQATKIDPDLMLEVARKMGVRPEKEVDRHRSWWDRWIRGTQNEALAQLHATLYSLVLGILDDVLEHTKITLLSDTLQFDLVPVPWEVQEAKRARAMAEALSEMKEEDEKEDASHEESSVALPFATFTAGLGIGLTLMSILGKR